MVKFEEVAPQVADISSDSDSDMPELENAENTTQASKMNRAEKKARKAMEKIGMTKVDAYRVTIKRAQAPVFAINNPEVMRSKNGETFVIFGEPKVEDFGALSAQAAAQRYATPEVSKVGGSAPSAPAVEEEEPTGPVDETGLQATDIELVISQVGCSRARAVNALREANGDIVEAIMHLSS
jgi:nascent polypeptide-associated complex subunit alpha